MKVHGLVVSLFEILQLLRELQVAQNRFIRMMRVAPNEFVTTDHASGSPCLGQSPSQRLTIRGCPRHDCLHRLKPGPPYLRRGVTGGQIRKPKLAFDDLGLRRGKLRIRWWRRHVRPSLGASAALALARLSVSPARKCLGPGCWMSSLTGPWQTVCRPFFVARRWNDAALNKIASRARPRHACQTGSDHMAAVTAHTRKNGLLERDARS